jgi:hypothetical protein
MAFLYTALWLACLRQPSLARRAAALRRAETVGNLASGRRSRQLDDVKRGRQRALAARLGFIPSSATAG